MSFRTFLDSSGVEWQAFDVVPRSEERRHYDRRGEDDESARFADGRAGDRRISVGASTSFQKRVAGGWLCFECEGERRRLSPIPDDWMRCSASQIERYCLMARVVPAAMTGRGH